MNGKELCLAERNLIIKIHEDGKSYGEIGKLMHKSRLTIRTVVLCYKNENRVKNKRRTGRPKKLSEREERKIKRIIQENPHAVQIQEQCNKNVHPDTVGRARKRAEGRSQQYVANLLGVNQSTIFQLSRCLLETGDVRRKPGRERKRATSAIDDRFLTLNSVVYRGPQVGTTPIFQYSHNWDIRLERLNEYSKANYVEDERKVPVLLTSLSHKVYEVLRELSYPDLPSTKAYENLCSLLARVKIFELKQNQGESINDWFVQVQKAAMECKFQASLDEYVKNKFITGMSRENVFDTLCEEDSEKNNTNSLCYACGRTSHDFKKCKFKASYCKVCHKKGYISTSPICKGKKPAEAQCHVMSDAQEVDVLDENHYVNFFYNDLAIFKVEPILLRTLTGNIDLNHELNSGSGVSAIPLSLYQEHFSKYQLVECNMQLRTYDGGFINPVGKLMLPIKINGETKEVKFIVVSGGIRPLLGKQSHYLEMDESEVNENTIGEVTNKIKHEFSDLFDGTLGKYKYVTVRVDIVPSVLPKFCKPRSILFAFKAGVEQELNRMKREEIITKIGNSKWATPLVPIIKGNKNVEGVVASNKIRICADYKVTLNPF
ncbi:hypothetical protein ILUMI_11781, partial [Ignelater luminosus]